MKKTTKNKIFTIVIGLLMLSSVVSYAFMSSSPAEETKQIVWNYEQETDEDTELLYIRNGFTLVKIYYQKADPSFSPFVISVSQLQDQIKPKQIIIEKIDSQEFSVKIKSGKGIEEISTQNMTSVFNSLCKILIAPPADCALV